MAAPPVRPGQPLYLGFRGITDSTFSLQIYTNGMPVALPQRKLMVRKLRSPCRYGCPHCAIRCHSPARWTGRAGLPCGERCHGSYRPSLPCREPDQFHQAPGERGFVVVPGPRLVGALARLAQARTLHPEAVEAYLKGRYEWNRRTGESIKQAIGHFNQAIARDPNYALAWAGLADSFLMMGAWSVLEPKDAYPRAKAAADRAIALDASLAEPYATIGYLKTLYERDWPGADAAFRRATDLHPDYATAHHWYAFYLANTGRLPEAIKELQRALEIDPLSLIIRGALAEALSEAGRHDEALTEVRKILEMDASFARGHLTLAAVYEQKGMFREAIAEIRKAQELGLPSEEAISRLGVLHARAGDRAEAEKAIRELEREANLEQVAPPAGALAMIYLALGDREQSLAWLQKGRELRDEDLLDLVWSRNCVPLRSDARFQALVKSMNFPE